MSACDACAAPCCRNYHVGVDAHDVWRIATELKLPVTSFATLTPSERADGEYRILLDASVPEEERSYHALGLRKAPDPDPAYEHRCVFLVTVGDRGRCGIYESRPGVCRVYPTSFHHGSIGTDGGGRYCPPGAWQLATVDVPLFRARWVHYNERRAVHQELVDGWNERLLATGEVHDEGRFLEFLLGVQLEMVRRRPDLYAERAIGRPDGHARAVIDEVLREMGWRTDETARHADPSLGRKPRLLLHADGDEPGVLVLDPEEEIDPEGSALARRLGFGFAP